MEIIWILWLWFIPFGTTMDSRIMTIPVYQRPNPEFTSKKECEIRKAELVKELAHIWPDKDANIEEIRVHCIPKQVEK